VIADEVTDTANKEELSLSLCFVNDGSVKEEFVDFMEVERKTGYCWLRLSFIDYQRMVSPQRTSEVSAAMVHPICQERYQDASPLFSKRPHSTVLTSIWQ